MKTLATSILGCAIFGTIAGFFLISYLDRENFVGADEHFYATWEFLGDIESDETHSDANPCDSDPQPDGHAHICKGATMQLAECDGFWCNYEVAQTSKMYPETAWQKMPMIDVPEPLWRLLVSLKKIPANGCKEHCAVGAFLDDGKVLHLHFMFRVARSTVSACSQKSFDQCALNVVMSLDQGDTSGELQAYLEGRSAGGPVDIIEVLRLLRNRDIVKIKHGGSAHSGGNQLATGGGG